MAEHRNSYYQQHYRHIIYSESLYTWVITFPSFEYNILQLINITFILDL